MNGDVDEVLRAIAEPRRRAILRLVATEELPAGRIAEHFEVTRSAVSQHLQILKDAGLVLERRDGTKRIYRASEDALAQLREVVESLWRESMARARDSVEGGDALRDEQVAG
ncbi:winged helix-turn-helix transcriptional regulator [Herbidospora galbida]|uniref:Winged helix-turn-helix transcriptional regulator n=1 Tax=Herbidospora galbida TaxID=2575442 RepID=A0A4U3MP68_9ACTN|nr:MULTISPECIES: metalloregulator ArsR/SmtB family transcription factor [Herbidospora]TKK91371.1 winged helix-turn-helix transcriptional regulator [Herbidospora galbida]